MPPSLSCRRWAALGFDLLCPPKCVFCGAEMPGADRDPHRRAEICAACSRSLATAGGRCSRCGQPAGEDPCGRCGDGLGDCSGIAVLGGYADAVRDAVLRSKRPSGDLPAAGLAALLVERHGDRLRGWRPDVVVPVPMHWSRRLVRGASAADELARGVATGLGLPLRRLLRRARATAMQNTLPRRDRPGNVAGAFRVRRDVAGRRVLLVDDVTTTGATLAACAASLRHAGAAVVFAAVAARADTLDADRAGGG